jgi:hypothetical protein
MKDERKLQSAEHLQLERIVPFWVRRRCELAVALQMVVKQTKRSTLMRSFERQAFGDTKDQRQRVANKREPKNTSELAEL